MGETKKNYVDLKESETKRMFTRSCENYKESLLKAKEAINLIYKKAKDKENGK